MQWKEFAQWLEGNGWRKDRFRYYKDTRYFMNKITRVRFFKGQVLFSARDFFDNDKWKTVFKTSLESLSINSRGEIVESVVHVVNRI